MLVAYPGLDDYFPVYSTTYIPGRKFFWEVFGSLYYDDAVRFINEQREDRYNLEEEEQNKKIKIDPVIYQDILSCKYFSKKRGRALNAVTYKQDDKANLSIRENQNYMNRLDNKENIEKSPFRSASPNKKLRNKLSAKDQRFRMQNDRMYDGGKKFQTPGNKDPANYDRFDNVVMMSADK